MPSGKVVPVQVRKEAAGRRELRSRPNKQIIKESVVIFSFDGSRVVKIKVGKSEDVLAILAISPTGKGYWFYEHRPAVLRKAFRMIGNHNDQESIVKAAVNNKDAVVELIKKTDETTGRSTFYFNLKHRKSGVKVEGALFAREILGLLGDA